MQLVDEEDDAAGRALDLREHGLQPLLELPAVLRAGEERADVERPHALLLEPFGDVARDDPLGEPLDDRGLPHAGLADENGVVLRPPREDLDHAPDLLVATDDRIELPFLRERGQVAPVLLERLVGALGILRRHLLPAAHLLERCEQRVARDDVEGEQQVLDRGELVAERAHLVEGLVEDARERGGCPRLRAASPDTVGRLRSRASASARSSARAVPGAIDERPRQLLVEERDRQVIGRQLGIAGAARELLRGRDRFLALQCQLVEIHVSSSAQGVVRTAIDDELALVGAVHGRDLLAQVVLESAACGPASGAARPPAGEPARRRRD